MHSPPFHAGAAAAGIMPRPGVIDNALHPQMTVQLDDVGSPLQVKALAMTIGKTVRRSTGSRHPLHSGSRRRLAA